MSFRTHVVRRVRGSGSLLALLVLGLAGCSSANYPQSALNPKGDFARLTDGLFTTTVWWALVVFVLVEGALVYAILRYRGSPDDAEPEQVHGNTTVEIIWTVIPALILSFIAVPTVRAIFKTSEIPTDNPLEVFVVGHQWWWEFRYPEYGLTTANELHVPVGRTVSLRMGTTDVLHSFWTPQLAGKRDVFPNRETRLWFKAEEAGNYPGQCAEFCGIQHGKMAFVIIAEEPAAFDAYIEDLRASGPPAATTSQGASPVVVPTQDTASRAAPADTGAAGRSDLIAQGQALTMKRGCIACHSFDANKPTPNIGPNLALVGRRTHIAAGILPNTDENLAAWIRNPQAIKEGVLMQNMGVTHEEAQTLVAYFRAIAR